MGFGRKKENPSSRYSRKARTWEDEEIGSTREGAKLQSEGYGVRDSYSRQASYGRPEGYYTPFTEEETAYRSPAQERDNLRASLDRGIAQEDALRAARDPGERERTRVYSRGYSAYDPEAYREQDLRRQKKEERRWQGDDWDDPNYDARLDEQAHGRGGRREEASGKRARSQTSRGGRSRGDEPVRSRGEEPARSAHLGRKIVLLLLATAALMLVWRFSRMERSPLGEILKNAGITGHDNVQDFVIYGVDSREGKLTEEAHSDTIILCSLNKSSKTVKLVSVYRDTYLDNTNGEFRKATECYYFGGPTRSVNMLNKNLDLSLEDYLTVDFNAVVKAVDLIGGVDVEVTPEELPYINGYQTENAQVTGAEITPVTEAGYQHLNGIQALAYCRIRYTEGSDYRRTERQRTVLSQIFERGKAQGPVRLAQIVDSMLPGIATSFSNTELLNLVSSLQDYTISESTGFPFDQQAVNISAGDCVVPVNLARNVEQLHAFLYGEQGYTPSATVQQISDEISSETGLW